MIVKALQIIFIVAIMFLTADILELSAPMMFVCGYFVNIFIEAWDEAIK